MTKRGMKMVLFAATLISVLPTNVGVASAKVLRWDLQDVTLPDGSTNIGAAASGYFLFDTATHAVVGWDIDVEGSIPPYPGACGPPQAAWQCFPAYRFIPPNSRLVGPLYGPFLSIPNENQALLDWSRADGNDFGDPVGSSEHGLPRDCGNVSHLIFRVSNPRTPESIGPTWGVIDVMTADLWPFQNRLAYYFLHSASSS